MHWRGIIDKFCAYLYIHLLQGSAFSECMKTKYQFLYVLDEILSIERCYVMCMWAEIFIITIIFLSLQVLTEICMVYNVSISLLNSMKT